MSYHHMIETSKRYYEAELCRVRAECALAAPSAGGTADALRWLERAIDVAREQGARLWEERATSRYATLAPSAARLGRFPRRRDRRQLWLLEYRARPKP